MTMEMFFFNSLIIDPGECSAKGQWSFGRKSHYRYHPSDPRLCRGFQPARDACRALCAFETVLLVWTVLPARRAHSSSSKFEQCVSRLPAGPPVVCGRKTEHPCSGHSSTVVVLEFLWLAVRFCLAWNCIPALLFAVWVLWTCAA